MKKKERDQRKRIIDSIKSIPAEWLDYFEGAANMVERTYGKEPTKS